MWQERLTGNKCSGPKAKEEIYFFAMAAGASKHLPQKNLGCHIPIGT
jgi:hypothetical protein